MKLTKINEDKRGEIYTLTNERFKFDELTIFFTKEGYARGGCLHWKSMEYYLVLQGKINYHIKDSPVKYCNVGDCGIIFPRTPHYFIALSDSVVLEWGATIEEKQKKDGKFRKIVEGINAKRKSN